MARLARALSFLLCFASCTLLAAAADSNPPAPDQFQVLRDMLDQQSKQIDVLAQEVARLNLLLTSKAEGTEALPAITPAPTVDATAAATTAVAEVDQPAAEVSPTPNPTPSGPVHIVTKGETLTAIARHYKVTVIELMKVNKIVDARKLQIGQILALPPNAKISQSPAPTPQP
jgi:LysM repeat protein